MEAGERIEQRLDGVVAGVDECVQLQGGVGEGRLYIQTRLGVAAEPDRIARVGRAQGPVELRGRIAVQGGRIGERSRVIDRQTYGQGLLDFAFHADDRIADRQGARDAGAQPDNGHHRNENNGQNGWHGHVILEQGRITRH